MGYIISVDFDSGNDIVCTDGNEKLLTGLGWAQRFEGMPGAGALSTATERAGRCAVAWRGAAVLTLCACAGAVEFAQEGAAGAPGPSADLRAAAAVHRQELDRGQGRHLYQGGQCHTRDEEPDDGHI